MQELATIVTQIDDNPPKPIYEQLEAESNLWYRRFKIFRTLGYHRTVEAALLKERETLQALPGTQKASESPKKPQTVKTSRNTRAVGHLTPLEQPKQVQIPGSWKRASIRHNWIERARAYDDYRIDQWVERNLDDLINGLALPYRRVQALNGLYESLAKGFNAVSSQLAPNEMLAYFARFQSIMRDIREEMLAYDESAMRVMLRYKLTKEYMKKPTPPPTKEPTEPPTMTADTIEQTLARLNAIEAAVKQHGPTRPASKKGQL